MNTLSSLLKNLRNRTPVGSLQMFAGSTAPTDWLMCDGRAVSRTTYASLYSVIGTTFGAGDGSTTFNLPDMRDRVPVGAGSTYSRNSKGGNNTISYTPASSDGKTGSTALTKSQMPAHNHGEKSLTGYFDMRKLVGNYHIITYRSGIVSAIGNSTNPAEGGVSGEGGTNVKPARISFNATHTHTTEGGGTGHTHTFTGKAASLDVRQKYIGINFIIYAGK